MKICILLCNRLLYLRVPSRRLQPPCRYYWGVRNCTWLHLTQRLGPWRRCQCGEPGNQTMWFYCSHLAIGVWQWFYTSSPWYVRGYPDADALHMWPGNSPSCNTEKSLRIVMNHRVADQLLPHHDSQFSAFSTTVFDQMNRKNNQKL